MSLVFVILLSVVAYAVLGATVAVFGYCLLGPEDMSGDTGMAVILLWPLVLLAAVMLLVILAIDALRDWVARLVAR